MTSKEFLRLTDHPQPCKKTDTRYRRASKHDKLQGASCLFLGLTSSFFLRSRWTGWPRLNLDPCPNSVIHARPASAQVRALTSLHHSLWTDRSSSFLVTGQRSGFKKSGLNYTRAPPMSCWLKLQHVLIAVQRPAAHRPRHNPLSAWTDLYSVLWS